MEEEVVQETQEKNDEAASQEQIDDITGIFVASRERHDGINATLSDVSVERRLTPVSEPFRVRSDNEVVTDVDIDKTLSIEDMRRTARQPEQRLWGSGSLSIRETLTRDDLQRTLQGDETAPSTVTVVDGSQHEDERIGQDFGWRHIVTATVDDIGLGRPATLTWAFEDEDKAQEAADTLREAAEGDADSRVTYDDGLSLTVQNGGGSFTERLTIDVNETLLKLAAAFMVWGPVLDGLWKGFLPLFLLFGSVLAAFAVIGLDDPPSPTTYEVHQRDGPMYTLEELRRELGGEAFDYDGITQRTPVTVRQELSDDEIRFVATDDKDDREWAIPVSEKGTIEQDDHLAFLMSIGADRLGEGNELVLRADVIRSDCSADNPTLVDNTGTYRLHPS